jgi:glucose/arabinose dehydrogenase
MSASNSFFGRRFQAETNSFRYCWRHAFPDNNRRFSQDKEACLRDLSHHRGTAIFRGMKLTRIAGIMALACSVSVASAGLNVGLKTVATGLTAPTLLIPYNKSQMLLGEQTGKLSLITTAGKITPFGDIKPVLCAVKSGFDERGLIGLALHPKFNQNKKLYIYYSAPLRSGGPKNWDHTSHVSEFKVAGDKLDLKSERILMRIDQPYFNHDGGRIAFGPDGMLYIGSGDGGHKNDINKPARRDRKTKKILAPELKARGPRGNGQDLSVLLGKILRIDVDAKSAGKQYGIPQSNPFVGRKGAQPEIWAYGIRNPWSLTFDTGGKNELFVGDVGQSRWEEVNIIRKGGNYGWNLREGNEWFNPKQERTPLDKPYTGGKPGKFIGPAVAYENMGAFGEKGKGRSITGGYVYRGTAIPALKGKYVFGDWSRNVAPNLGILYVATRAKGGKWSYDALGINAKGETNLGAFLWAFGSDANGELYIMTNPKNTVSSDGKGMIQKLVPLK